MIEAIYLILAAGAIGGFVKSMMESKGRILLPAYEEVMDTVTLKKEKYVHMGILGNAFLGAVTGVFLTTDPMAAFAAGISAGFLLEGLIEKGAPNIIPTKIES